MASSKRPAANAPRPAVIRKLYASRTGSFLGGSTFGTRYIRTARDRLIVGQNCETEIFLLQSTGKFIKDVLLARVRFELCGVQGIYLPLEVGEARRGIAVSELLQGFPGELGCVRGVPRSQDCLNILGGSLGSGSRVPMLIVGSIFVFFSGLMYFLFMVAWLNLFFLVGHMRSITLAAGLVALVVALINVKDYFWFKQGVSLSIPDSAKPGLFRRMNALLEKASLLPLLAGTAALAFAANLYEHLCTSDFPLVYTRILTLRELTPGTYYGYLLLYNVIYLLPLALIVLLFSLAPASHKLTEYQGRFLKLVSGSMMLFLGVVLLIRPEFLNDISGAMITLCSAVGMTLLIALLERWWLRTHHDEPTHPRRRDLGSLGHGRAN